MKTNLYLVLIACIFLLLDLYPQTNVTDSKNETTIGFLERDGGILSFNTVEKKIIFGYGKMFNKKNFLNLEIVSPATDDIAEIFSESQFVTDLKFSIKLGFCVSNNNFNPRAKRIIYLQSKPGFAQVDLTTNFPVLGAAWDLWLFIGANYSPQKNRLFFPNNAYKNQILEKTFDGYEANVGINYWSANFIKTNIALTLGASIGIKRVINDGDFKKKEIETYSEFRDELTEEIRRIKLKTVEALYMEEGKIYEERFEIPLKIDMFLNPFTLKNIGFYFYSRFFFQTKDSYLLRKYFGAGVYTFKNNDPIDTIGGLVCELVDKSDVTADIKSFKNRLKIFLTIGIKLFGSPGD